MVMMMFIFFGIEWNKLFNLNQNISDFLNFLFLYYSSLLYLDFLVRFEDFSGEEDSSSDDEEVF